MEFNICDNYALRLFNDKGYNLPGIGTTYYGNFIIIPNVDKPAYKQQNLNFSKQVEIVSQSLFSLTGELVVDFSYITALIKCKETNKLELTDDIFKRCICYLKYEIRQFRPRHVLCLGNVAQCLFNVSVSELLGKVIYHNGIFYSFDYNPSIKLYDVDKFNIFEEHLVKWYNMIKFKNYRDYEILVYD